MHRVQNPQKNFNPRPPRGGRLCNVVTDAVNVVFQSTPSARRATFAALVVELRDFISIHALREEGDWTYDKKGNKSLVFQSTPSARRATDIR